MRRVVLVMLCAACEVGETAPPEDDVRVCAEPDPALLATLPPWLSQTGLFEDTASRTLAAGVVAYTPEFELWSGGAAKQRWMWLPPGERIDTSDPDGWQFPVGTRFWKEFVVDGVRVETRLLARVGAGVDDWAAASYVWNPEGTEARIAPQGEAHALGTLHDVPRAAACMGCHVGSPGRILGFSAIQLAKPALPGEIGLAELRTRDLVTRPQPSIGVPGQPAQRRAIGWLHANCGHCHNPRRSAVRRPRCFDPRKPFDLSLRVGELEELASTAVYRTAIGTVIAPGEPDGSLLVERIRAGDMPPLGVEALDQRGLQSLTDWIRGL